MPYYLSQRRMFNMNKSIRFIAGAICPSCQKIDKISYQKEGACEKILCVNCGYNKSQNHFNQLEETQ